MTATAPHAPVRLWGTTPLETGKAPGADDLDAGYSPPVGRMVAAPWLVSTKIVSSETAMSWADHSHVEHELLWSPTGNVTVEAQGRVWMVPPVLGIWLPAGSIHRVRAKPGARTVATYVNPELALASWDTVMGISLSPALRELIYYNHVEVLPDEVRSRLQQTIVDLMTPVQAATLDIPMPRSADLEEIARAIIAAPQDARTVEALAAGINVSGRTLMRRFQAETGISLARWRNLVRVRLALLELAGGSSVAAVSRRLGYSNPSTFIALFRQVTGHTPAAYFRRMSERDADPLS